MITVEIPGFRTFTIRHLVLDVNGTLAKDGHLIEGTVPLLNELRSKLEVHLVTADTHGKQEDISRTLAIEAVKIPAENQVKAKLDYINRLDADTVAAIGNGFNDSAMLEHAGLGIAVIGPEGAAAESMLKAKIVAPDILSALELLLYPKRLAATLRR